MEGLDKIFESLDDKIFTTDLKRKLNQQFNESVERKSDEVVDARLEEELERLSEKSNEHIELLEKTYEDKISELEIKSEDHIDLINEKAVEFINLKADKLSEELVNSRIEELETKSEEHIDFLNEKAVEFVDLQREQMAETVGSYMDRVVEEFVSETKETLSESVKSSHADMLIEAFDSMMVAGGVNIADIVESREVTGSASLEESKRKYDVLVNENIDLKEQNDKLINMGVISEVKEGLSLVESDKFESLAKLVEFSKSSDYLKKLETIRESVAGAKVQESVPTLRTSSANALNENVSGDLICQHLL